jgi:hypothetical protein
LSGDYEQPSGLYVEHHGILLNPTTCILPHIDEAQTEQVIEAIYHRFPDTAHSSNSEPYLTSLNLESPQINQVSSPDPEIKNSKTKAKLHVKPQNQLNY